MGRNRSNATAPAVKGNLVAGTGADTSGLLTVGANGTVLTADSAEATGIKWGTISAGGMTLLSTTTLSGATTTISSIDQTYTDLQIVIFGVTNATANGLLRIAPNSVTNISSQTGGQNDSSDFRRVITGYIQVITDNDVMIRTNADNAFVITISRYAASDRAKAVLINGGFNQASTLPVGTIYGGMITTTSGISSLQFSSTGGNLSTGTVLIYGVK